NLLKQFAAASLARQTRQDFTWILNANPNCPLYGELCEFLETLPFATAIATGEPPNNPTDVIDSPESYWKSAIRERLNHETVHVLTTRLDDDDLLSPDFVARLRDKVRA